MRPEWQAQIDGLLTQYRQMQANLGHVRQKMTEVSATAQSPDGLISATVGYRGDLTALEIDPRALRPADPQALADSIVAATQAAVEQVREEIHEVMAPAIPDPELLSRVSRDVARSGTGRPRTDPRDLMGAADLIEERP